MDIFIANIVLFRFKVPHFGGVAGHVGKLLKHELLVLLNGYMIYPQERRGFFIMKKRLCRASIFAVCVTFVSEVRDQQLNKKSLRCGQEKPSSNVVYSQAFALQPVT